MLLTMIRPERKTQERCGARPLQILDLLQIARAEKDSADRFRRMRSLADDASRSLFQTMLKDHRTLAAAKIYLSFRRARQRAFAAYVAALPATAKNFR